MSIVAYDRNMNDEKTQSTHCHVHHICVGHNPGPKWELPCTCR